MARSIQTQILNISSQIPIKEAIFENIFQRKKGAIVSRVSDPEFFFHRFGRNIFSDLALDPGLIWTKKLVSTYLGHFSGFFFVFKNALKAQMHVSCAQILKHKVELKP